jgi:hypothetical protein
VVFNDLSVAQLFAAYQKKLKVKLRAADGVPNPTDDLTTLTEVKGIVETPFRDALKKLIDDGKLPCVGQITDTAHGLYKSPVPLRPAMAYTLDIEVDPPNPPVTDQPILPLYRFHYTTSRFPNLTALVAQLRASLMLHRPLSAMLTGLPGGAVVTATDLQIQEALRVAGEQALPAAALSGIRIYWAKRNGQDTYTPHAILIDAAEPLWRTRSEPRLETVPGQDDPAFQRIVAQKVEAMRIIEEGGATISKFVRSPGGTRTLAIFSDSFTPQGNGTTIKLIVQRLKSDLFGIPELKEALPVITLVPSPPWENDNV